MGWRTLMSIHSELTIRTMHVIGVAIIIIFMFAGAVALTAIQTIVL